MKVSKKEKEYLNKLNISAKRKAKRLEQQHGITGVFEVKKEFASRKELNKYKEQAEFFTSRSTYKYVKESETGISVPEQDYKLLQRANKRINKEREQIWNNIKNNPYKYNGVEYGDTNETYAKRAEKSATGSPYTEYLNPLPEKNLTKGIKNLEDWNYLMKKRLNRAFKQTIRSTYYDNFISAIETRSKLADNSKRNFDVDKLIAKIKTLSVSDFIELYEQNTEQLDLSWFYLNNEDISSKFEKIFNVFGVGYEEPEFSDYSEETEDEIDGFDW